MAYRPHYLNVIREVEEIGFYGEKPSIKIVRTVYHGRKKVNNRNIRKIEVNNIRKTGK